MVQKMGKGNYGTVWKAINKLKKNIRNNLVYKDSAHRSIPIKAESPAVTPKKQNKNDDRLTIKEKMLTLKELHEQGLITDTEYSDKKLELLNTL